MIRQQSSLGIGSRVLLVVVAALCAAFFGVSRASAATGGPVLILGTSVDGAMFQNPDPSSTNTVSMEALAVYDLGLVPEVLTPTQWGNLTAADIQNASALVLGDLGCTHRETGLGGGTGPIGAALGNRGLWGPLVSGNVVVTGQYLNLWYHGDAGGGMYAPAYEIVKSAIEFATSGATTGASISLSCMYGAGGIFGNASAHTPVHVLDTIDAGGGFTVQGSSYFTGPVCNTQSTSLVANLPTTLSNLTDASFTPPHAPNYCPAPQVFDAYPSDFHPIAILQDRASGPAWSGSTMFANGKHGSPFMLARGSAITVVDTTPPWVNCGAADAAWHASDVLIGCTAGDIGTGLANPADAAFNLTTSVPNDTETANASTDSHTVCDLATPVNCATAGPVSGIKVDKKKPTVACAAAPLGWQAAEVSIACTGLDNGSGLASAADASFTLTTNVGAGAETSNAATNSHDVCDNVNNCATGGPVGGIMIDRKDPTAPCDPVPAGWVSDNVTLTCHGADGGSGLLHAADATFQLGTSVPPGSEDSAAATGSHQVCDALGHCVTAGPFTGKVDRKAPTVTCGSAPAGWLADNVSIACSAVDGGAGLASAGDAAFSLVTNVPAGSDDAAASTGSRNVCDLSVPANCTVAGPFTVKVDRKAPTIQITSPTGANLTQNQVVAPGYACNDGSGSGLAAVGGCTGPATVDTSTLGLHTYTVNAKDNVGNTSSQSVSYTVVAAPSTSSCTVEGSGAIGRNLSFDFNAKSGKNPEGELRFTDKGGTKHSFKSAKITGVSCSGSDATVTGTGRDNGGALVSFTVQVKQTAKHKADTFSISWGSYSAGGTLTDGEITVRIGGGNDNNNQQGNNS